MEFGSNFCATSNILVLAQYTVCTISHIKYYFDLSLLTTSGVTASNINVSLSVFVTYLLVNV